MIVDAKLIKRKTDDEMMEFEDDIPLGKIYKVDLETKQKIQGLNIITNNIWEREMIMDITGSFLPTELLEIGENNVNEGK
jgi:uncharacterized protein YajQ (UPF0234 family)